MANITQNNSFFSFVTPVKLDKKKFILWRTQVLTSVKRNCLEGFINGDHEFLSSFLSPRAIMEMKFQLETILDL